MSQLDEFFKWKCGDEVTLRQGIGGFDSFTLKPKIGKLVIVERVLRQCTGGVQMFYAVRLFGTEGSTRYVEFNEIELMDLPAPEPK